MGDFAPGRAVSEANGTAVSPVEISSEIDRAARELGFVFSSIVPAADVADFERFSSWQERGLAGEMKYLTDHRADLRQSLENLLPGVKSVIVVGMNYNGPEPHSTRFDAPDRAWIARYAWGEDYHDVLRSKLEGFAEKLLKKKSFQWRACIDTAPLLERSLARQAGLGWFGRNTCLINQKAGSWFFLGELLTTLDPPSNPAPAPDRCGTCRRCIDACPTAALVPSPDGGYELDARRCISYLTIELRGPIPEDLRAPIGNNVFGCDICQDVCPWNRKAPVTAEPAFRPRVFAPPLEAMAALEEAEFRAMFRGTPVTRAKHRGFLRNVAVAMGNAGLAKFRAPLERLAGHPDPLVSEHAQWALGQISG